MTEVEGLEVMKDEEVKDILVNVEEMVAEEVED